MPTKTAQVSLKLTPELSEKLRSHVLARERSLNWWVTNAITLQMAREAKAKRRKR